MTWQMSVKMIQSKVDIVAPTASWQPQPPFEAAEEDEEVKPRRA
jgi:hypothetical protein